MSNKPHALLTHQPCPDCGSSDALTVNSDGSTYCFSCRTSKKNGFDLSKITKQTKSKPGRKPYDKTHYDEVIRGLKGDTLRKYRCGLAVSNNLLDRDRFVFRYPDDAQKVRVISTKQFYWLNSGRSARAKRLFGANIQDFKVGGPICFITEGEFDAMSVYQMTGSPAFSVSGGATSAFKDIAGSMELLSTYSKVVLFFDNDEAGIEASRKVRKYLERKKINVCEWRHTDGFKDANEILLANRTDLIKEQFKKLTGQSDMEIFYNGASEKFFVRRTDGSLTITKRAGIRALLGMSNETLTKQDIDAKVSHLVNPLGKHAIDGDAVFPYFKSQIYSLDGKKILNTFSGKILEPKQGPATILNQLLLEMFGNEQLKYIQAWLSNFIKECNEYNPKQGPALYIAGDSGSGKTFFQDIILGSIVGEPGPGTALFKTGYNADALERPYISVSDMPAEDTQRGQLTAMVKQLVASTEHLSNRKYGGQNKVKWAGRLIISLNLDEYSEAMLPAVQPSDWEKFMLIKVTKGETIVKYNPDEWKLIVEKEAPELCYQLLNHKVPEEIKDIRFGVKAYHNPELLEIIKNADPLTKYSIVLQELLASRSQTALRMTADNLFSACLELEATKHIQLRHISQNLKVLSFKRKLEELIKKYSWIRKVGNEYEITKEVDF